MLLFKFITEWEHRAVHSWNEETWELYGKLMMRYGSIVHHLIRWAV